MYRICERKEKSMIEHPLEPIIDEQCEVLILGSFPSVKSREISFIMVILKIDFGRLLVQSHKQTMKQ